MADSLCHTEEAEIAVHRNYTLKKKKKSDNFTFVKKPLELMVTKREKVMGVIRMNWEAEIDIYTLLLLVSRFSRVQLCATL